MNKPPVQKTTATTKPEKTESKPADVSVLPATNALALPPITTDAPQVAIADVGALSDADLNTTLKALRTELRRRENEREALRPKVGAQVRILRGRSKYVGKVGTAVIVRKSRCFVAVPEISQPAYVLVTDVELVKQ